MMKFELIEGIKGGHGGCQCCGYQYETLPMESIIAVGFGCASLDAEDCIYDEQQGFNPRYNRHIPLFMKKFHDRKGFLPVIMAETIAQLNPDHDWRIHLVAPLSERHYQRHSHGKWVLYEKGMGFA